MALTFYGHANIGSVVCAVCDVDGGPSYEFQLQGEASLVSYQFDCLEIHYNRIVSSTCQSIHCLAVTSAFVILHFTHAHSCLLFVLIFFMVMYELRLFAYTVLPASPIGRVVAGMMSGVKYSWMHGNILLSLSSVCVAAARSTSTYEVRD